MGVPYDQLINEGEGKSELDSQINQPDLLVFAGNVAATIQSPAGVTLKNGEQKSLLWAQLGEWVLMNMLESFGFNDRKHQKGWRH